MQALAPAYASPRPIPLGPRSPVPQLCFAPARESRDVQRDQAPPTPSRIRCSTPSPAAKSPPPGSQDSCTLWPPPPRRRTHFPPPPPSAPRAPSSPRGAATASGSVPRWGRGPARQPPGPRPAELAPPPSVLGEEDVSLAEWEGGCVHADGCGVAGGAPRRHTDVSSDTPSLLACSEQVGSRGTTLSSSPDTATTPPEVSPWLTDAVCPSGPRGHKPVTYLLSVSQSVAAGWTTFDQLTREG